MIKSSDFISDEAKQKAQLEAIGALMNSFTDAMFHKLTDKVISGYKGWDNPNILETLKSKLADNINDQDWVDVANIAMFLWNLKQK